MLAISALAALVALQNPVSRVAFSDTVAGIEIALPTGWIRIPDQNMRANEDLLRRRGENAIHYAAGFTRGDAKEWFQYPYVMIQVYDSGAENPATLAIQLNSSIPQPTNSRILKGTPSYGIATYDPTKDAVLWNYRQSVADGRQLAGYLGYRMTKAGFVGVYAYGLESDSSSTKGTLFAFLAGLSVDPAHAYSGPSGDSSRIDEASRAGAGQLLQSALGVVAVFGMFAVVLLVLRARGKA